jgi:5-methylcytosine-specific restriction endonuclease McrA
VKAQNDRRLANIDESRKKTREYLREWRVKNPEKQAAINKKYDEKNRDKRSAYAKQYRKDNPEKVQEQTKAWAKANPEKIKAYSVKAGRAWHERNPEYLKEHYKANKERYVAARARRRAAQESATPSWLTAVDKAMIQEMYDVSEARYIQTGIKHHVDHIVPINGKGVAGMHVPWNLQVITAHENLSKGWRF